MKTWKLSWERTKRFRFIIKQLEQIIGIKKCEHNTITWRLAYLIHKLEDDRKWYTRVLDLALDRLIDEKYTGGKIVFTHKQALQIKELYAHV